MDDNVDQALVTRCAALCEAAYVRHEPITSADIAKFVRAETCELRRQLVDAERIVESHRTRADDKQGAWEHQVLIRADLEHKIATIAEELRAEQTKSRELQTTLNVIRSPAEDVWFWENNGENAPESLACPVVMTADRVRAFVETETRAKHLEKVLRAWREAHDIHMKTPVGGSTAPFFRALTRAEKMRDAVLKSIDNPQK